MPKWRASIPPVTRVPMPPSLRPATARDLIALSDLCLRSKAVWGYDETFLAACRDELTLTEPELESTSIALVERNGRAIAVGQIEVTDGVSDLLKLFVDPSEMGQGLGARLFAWAVAEGRRLGAERMTIEADPDAESFYRRMGAHVIGQAPSGSIPGRVLPLLELSLT